MPTKLFRSILPEFQNNLYQIKKQQKLLLLFVGQVREVRACAATAYKRFLVQCSATRN